jgi:LPS-assembly protein
MNPHGRKSVWLRRGILGIGGAMLGCGGLASAAELACERPADADPRIAELLLADPDNREIDLRSDGGELGRDGTASLRGNVEIRTGQRLLRADEAEVDSVRRSAVLRGNVEYLDPTLHVRGTGGRFAGDGTGGFEGAEFQLLEQSVRGKASKAEVVDARRLELSDVWYTACPVGSDDWRLQANSISIDQQSQIGTGRDVKLEFQGVPILYLPYISFPVGVERKTGVLFPTVGSSSRSGTQVAVPWYWNIAPNYDATFTGRYMSQRGLRVDPQFRYLDERTRAQLDAEYLFDDLEDDGSRSYVQLKSVTHFAPRLRLGIDAANASDDDYFEDFGLGFEGTSVIFLNRLAELQFEDEHWWLTARTQNYQVIDDAIAPEDRPYTLLPQLAAEGYFGDLVGGLGAGLSGEFSNFQRSYGVAGQRLDLQPYLDLRADGPGWFTTATAAFDYTQYALDRTAPGEDDGPSRSTPIVNLDGGLVFEREVGSRNQRVQTLEPRASWLYVPYRDQDDLPVFDTGVPDLNLVQLFRTNRYVGPDRLGDANQLALGLTTRLLDGRQGRQFLTATLGQAYFFETPRVRLPDEPDTRRDTSDLIAEVEVSAFQDWNLRYAQQWNPDESLTERSELLVQYRPRVDSVVNAGYRYRRGDVEQFDVSAAWPFGERWRAFGRWVYSTREEKTLDQVGGFEYGDCCWALRLVARRFVSSRTGDSDTSIGLELELKGLSSVGVDNQAFLRESIRGYSSAPFEP